MHRIKRKKKAHR